MPITFTAITFTTPDEFVEVASRLDDFSIRELMQALGSTGQTPYSLESAIEGAKATVPPRGTASSKHVVVRSGRRGRGSEGSLVDQIKQVIQNFIANNQEFTANSVFEALDTGKVYINKKSVVSSVQKLMREGEFAKIPREDRRGDAPRAKKVYLPH